MNNLKCTISFLSLVFCIPSARAQLPKGEMYGAEEIKFKSTINNQDYVLFIKLPDSYKSDSIRRYPVVYSTDGQWIFPLMMDIRGGLIYDNLTPEMIFVGIAWPDNFFINRIRDFFPARTDEFPDAGGADKFLNVIKLEIKRKIDSTYRTDKVNSTLFGTSAGGFFALYTLFSEPDLFNGHIVCSPSLMYNDEAA
jgi:predicted alpha/beta superfamily hydrolase